MAKSKPRSRRTIQGRVVYDRKEHIIKPSDIRRFIRGRLINVIQSETTRGTSKEDAYDFAMHSVLGRELSIILISLMKEFIAAGNLSALTIIGLEYRIKEYYDWTTSLENFMKALEVVQTLITG